MAMTTTAYYLDRLDIYTRQKPYIFARDVAPSAGLSTNHSYVPVEVQAYNAQPDKDRFSLDVHGFQFGEWKSAMSGADFGDDGLVRDKYYPETTDRLMHLLPESLEIHVLSHLVCANGQSMPATCRATADGLIAFEQKRKRDESFLNARGESRTLTNPAVYAHSDFSTKGAAIAIEKILQQHGHLRGRKYDMINTWRVIRGPNRDWPLGLCDYQTVALDDVETSDVIQKSHIGESTRLYANPAHRWYFLDNQSVDQVIIFRNVHSDGFTVPFAAHLSFPNPDISAAASSFPRESIEVRMVRFFQ